MKQGEFISVSAAARRAGTSRQRIHKAIKDKVLPVAFETDGITLLDVKVFDKWSSQAKSKGGRPKKEAKG